MAQWRCQQFAALGAHDRVNRQDTAVNQDSSREASEVCWCEADILVLQFVAAQAQERVGTSSGERPNV